MAATTDRVRDLKQRLVSAGMNTHWQAFVGTAEGRDFGLLLRESIEVLRDAEDRLGQLESAVSRATSILKQVEG